MKIEDHHLSQALLDQILNILCNLFPIDAMPIKNTESIYVLRKRKADVIVHIYLALPQRKLACLR